MILHYHLEFTGGKFTPSQMSQVAHGLAQQLWNWTLKLSWGLSEPTSQLPTQERTTDKFSRGTINFSWQSSESTLLTPEGVC
jgi:hypothetical protein